jgi:hypothetical protein
MLKGIAGAFAEGIRKVDNPDDNFFPGKGLPRLSAGPVLAASRKEEAKACHKKRFFHKPFSPLRC